MKKRFQFLFCAAAIAFSSCLISCSKSNADLIDDYKKVCTELVEATQKGDVNKIKSLAEKGDKILDELNKRELTDEEKQEVLNISVEAANGAFSAAYENSGLGM
ncbi:MAG: hypothetical protein J1E97_04835 [Muribaculaceae bacterium]|nr:hypothetical protein [Muribaculaceae bacterium]